jgi:hypothetical protein
MQFKKGSLMVKFLVTVILAILIFVPACVVSAKFFRLSDQARDDFIDFTTKLKKFENPNTPIQSKETVVNIMDEGTAIIYVETGEEKVSLFIETETFGSHLSYQFARPSSCPIDKGCLCLYREMDVENYLPGDLITSRNPLCQNFDTMIRIDSCNFGDRGPIVLGCSGGFVIERFLPESLIQAIDSTLKEGTVHTKAGRRVALTITKESDYISIAKAGTN